MTTGPSGEEKQTRLELRSYNMIASQEIEAFFIEAPTPNHLFALTRSPGTNAVPHPSSLVPRH